MTPRLTTSVLAHIAANLAALTLIGPTQNPIVTILAVSALTLAGPIIDRITD